MRPLTTIVAVCGVFCCVAAQGRQGAESYAFWIGFAPKGVTRDAIEVLGHNGIRAGFGDEVNRAPVLAVAKESDQLRAIAILSRMGELRKRGLVLFGRKYDAKSKRYFWMLDPRMPAAPGN